MPFLYRDRETERIWGNLMPMMADQQLQGSAESGYGVRLVGFYASSGEFAKKLAELIAPSFARRVLAQCETIGFKMLLVSESDPAPDDFLGVNKVATYRQEPHKFFVELPKFLKPLCAKAVQDMVLTESYGAITLTLIYSEAISSGGSSA